MRVTLRHHFFWVVFDLLVAIINEWSSRARALFVLAELTPSPPPLALLFYGFIFILLLFLIFFL